MAAIFPVIMCGGAGTRLWPASRPSRPKPFIPLSGNRSPFQETVERVAPLVTDGGVLVVVGGAAHRQTILEQLEETGQSAVVLLEPEGRESAAAMAAAALWTRRQQADAINLFVASDHHIPDQDAFRQAVATAAAAAEQGRIVTLGLVPTEASPAYGYIAPQGPGLAEVRAFIEKPDRDTAGRYIAAGYLWNSGNFIVRADVLDQEIRQSTVGLSEAVARALDEASDDGDALLLGPSFAAAPRISIDYAVMEKTQRASVLPVDFEWSDLGSWDTVHASGEGDVGLHVLEDSDGCLVRACDGVMVAAIGVRNLGIIVERDAVLVTDLARSQDVKKVVRRLSQLSPQHLDFAPPPEEGLEEGLVRLAAWLRQSALPLWCTLGQQSDGRFETVLGLDGRRLDAPASVKMQLRQLQVYAEAGRWNWQGPWRATLRSALKALAKSHDDDALTLHERGLLEGALGRIALVAPDLLTECGWANREREPLRLSEAIAASERSSRYISLLDASLADDPAQAPHLDALADQIMSQVRARFLDAEAGVIGEQPLNQLERNDPVDPGRQFEWAWLVARYGLKRGDRADLDLARKLFASGRRGVDLTRRAVIDAMSRQGERLSTRARLSAQTQWMKAALTLAEAADDQRETFLGQAAQAQRAVWNHLLPSGQWRAKRLENGLFIDEPAEADGLHAVMAIYSQAQEARALWRPATLAALNLY